MRRSTFVAITLLLSLGSIDGQIATGGQYSLEKSAVAGGGGVSGNGQYSLTGTIGQPAAGKGLLASGFDHQPGFWASELAPTAAMVSISGRVSTANGTGIRNVLISLTSSSGNVRTALSSSFGYYRFDDVEVGSNYLISVSSKRFGFDDPTRIVIVTDELSGIDFRANESGQNLFVPLSHRLF